MVITALRDVTAAVRRDPRKLRAGWRAVLSCATRPYRQAARPTVSSAFRHFCPASDKSLWMERDGSGHLLAYEAFVPDLDPDGVEEDECIERIERPVPPLGHFL